MEGLECQDKTFVLSYLRQAPDMCIIAVQSFFCLFLAHWVFVATCGLFVAVLVGFSCCRAWALECRLSSCDAQTL